MYRIEASTSVGGKSGANFSHDSYRWGVFSKLQIDRNPNKKGGLVSRLRIAGEGFEPPTFGL
jgi:hypothetical protein